MLHTILDDPEYLIQHGNCAGRKLTDVLYQDPWFILLKGGRIDWRQVSPRLMRRAENNAEYQSAEDNREPYTMPTTASRDNKPNF